MTTEVDNQYATHATGTAGISLGTVGTVLGAVGVLGAGSGLLGGFGSRRQENPDGRFITKAEFDLNTKLMDKDTQIAILESDRYTDQKLVEVYTELAKQINGVKDRIDSNRDRTDDKLATSYDKLNSKIDFNKQFQDGINAQQMAYNGTNNATIACMQNQIADLKSITAIKIPNENLCPGVPTVILTHPQLSAV